MHTVQVQLTPTKISSKDETVDVDDRIAAEVALYVGYCRLACRHDENEELYRQLAHVIAYHIKEMHETQKVTVLGQVSA